MTIANDRPFDLLTERPEPLREQAVQNLNHRKFQQNFLQLLSP